MGGSSIPTHRLYPGKVGATRKLGALPNTAAKSTRSPPIYPGSEPALGMPNGRVEFYPMKTKEVFINSSIKVNL